MSSYDQAEYDAARFEDLAAEVAQVASTFEGGGTPYDVVNEIFDDGHGPSVDAMWDYLGPIAEHFGADVVEVEADISLVCSAL